MAVDALAQATFWLADAQATQAMGDALAQSVQVNSEQPLIFFLQGDLGAGKTTLSQGFVRGCGHTGSVKSPTYTLVEPYESLPVPIYHFDLYRLADPEELEFLGFRDYLAKRSILLIEWPQKGAGYLPQADVTISVTVEKSASGVGRLATLTAATAQGEKILAALSKCWQN